LPSSLFDRDFVAIVIGCIFSRSVFDRDILDLGLGWSLGFRFRIIYARLGSRGFLTSRFNGLWRFRLV
jgi:hypothetical protein